MWPACSSPERSGRSRRTRSRWERTARRTRDARESTRPDHHGHAERGAHRVQDAIARIAVLLQVKVEELVVCMRTSVASAIAVSSSVPLEPTRTRRQVYYADAELAAIRYYLLQVLLWRDGSAMRIGILTGGGDCPGLNAVIRAVVRKGILHYDDEFVGFMEGWRGVVENKTMALDYDAISGILPRGGTILRTSRTNPSKREGGLARCMETLQAQRARCFDRHRGRRHQQCRAEAVRARHQSRGRS